MSASTEIHFGEGVWRADRLRSTVSFDVRHLGVATVRIAKIAMNLAAERLGRGRLDLARSGNAPV